MGTDRRRLIYSHVLMFNLRKSPDYNPVLFDFKFYFTISHALLISFKSRADEQNALLSADE